MIVTGFVLLQDFVAPLVLPGRTIRTENKCGREIKGLPAAESRQTMADTELIFLIVCGNENEKLELRVQVT